VVRPPYWIGWRLIHLAVTHWPLFQGQILYTTGRDPLELPLPALLNLIYAWWIREAADAEVAKFDAALTATPASADMDDLEDWSDEDTDYSFGQALTTLRAR
jgi:hypothetical protein